MEFKDAKQNSYIAADTSELNASVNVSIFSTDLEYQQIIKELLSNAGFNPLTLEPNSTSLANPQNAAVICFRAETDGPRPVIPTGINGQRIVVFSNHQSEDAIVHCLERGAHHHIYSEQSPTVLQARLEAALRHHDRDFQRFLEVEPFKFDLERRNIYLNNKLINLSPKEYEFAYYLFSNRHRVVVNSELMMSVWSLPSTMDARRIDTAACRVRKKLQLSENSSGWCLRRIRRVGYELLCKGELDTSLPNPIHAFASPLAAAKYGEAEKTTEVKPAIAKYASA